MKKLKFKMLWVVDCQFIQWGAFQYKKEAIAFAKKINGIVLKNLRLVYQLMIKLKEEINNKL